VVTSSLLPNSDDTIAAIATAPGRGAIALVRISGPHAKQVARRVIHDWDQVEPRRVRRVSIIHPSEGRSIDHGLVTLFEGPASYTGDDVVELSVHGGAMVPVLVLEALIAAGARQALPGEFTRRAVANGRMDLLQAEAVADLVDARSQLGHGVALRQLEGGLSKRATALRESILDLEAMIAYDIDFPEEDQGTVDRGRVDALLEKTVTELDMLLGTAEAGEMIREGALVVIGGAPNAGKSSLFNALLGRQRAIVTDIPGTTRDAIEATIEIHTWPVRLVDTAGLREAKDVVERLGIEISERYLADADVVILCGETGDELILLRDRIRPLVTAPVLLAQTKADLRPGHANAGIPVSSVTGEGLDALSEAIGGALGDRFGAIREAPMLTRARHREGVNAARHELVAFRTAWTHGDPPSSVAAVHLRQAAHHLAELIGSVDVEDVLGRVFSTFCVGK
jgi:tRNA modification GTPase